MHIQFSITLLHLHGSKKGCSLNQWHIAGAQRRRQGIKARIDVGSVTIIMHPHARLSLYVLIHSTINNTRSEKYLLAESEQSQSYITWRIKQMGSIWNVVPSNILDTSMRVPIYIHSCHSCKCYDLTSVVTSDELNNSYSKKNSKTHF